MTGHKAFVSKTERISELEYEQLNEELKAHTSIIEGLYKATITNDLNELAVRAVINIYTNVDNFMVDNTIKSSPEWYQSKDKNSLDADSEDKAWDMALKELKALCSKLNIYYECLLHD